MTYLRILALLILLSSVPHAQSRPEASIRREARTGHDLMTAGVVITLGGISLGAGSLYAKNAPAVRNAGIAAFLAGIPVIGWGSYELRDAAQAADPGFKDPSYNWVSYGLSLAVVAAGGLMAAGLMDDGGGYERPASTAYVILGGLAWQGVVGAGFIGECGKAGKLLKARRLTMAPVLPVPGGTGNTGLEFAYRF